MYDFAWPDDVREMLEVERVEELMGSLRGDESIKSINLSNKSFSAEAAKLAGEILSSLPNLEVACLADTIAGRPEQVGLEALTALAEGATRANLKVLDLSENAMGMKGMKAVQPCLRAAAASLESLTFCDNGLESDAANLLADCLVGEDDSRQLPNLKSVLVWNNLMECGGAKGVARIVKLAPNLEQLRFSATRVKVEGAMALANALLESGTTSLTSIDLSDNVLENDTAELLREVLSKQPHLCTVNLEATFLGNEGVSNILNGIGEQAEALSKTLKHLVLSANDICIEDEADVSCFQVLAQLEALEEVSLDENELRSLGGKVIFRALRQHKHIKTLRLQQCELGAACVPSLLRAMETFRESLQTLALDENYFSDDAMAALQGRLADESFAHVTCEFELNDAECLSEPEDFADSEEE